MKCSRDYTWPRTSSTSWFQTSRYCRAKVEFNSVKLVRHGSSTTFETGLRVCSNYTGELYHYKENHTG